MSVSVYYVDRLRLPHSDGVSRLSLLPVFLATRPSPSGDTTYLLFTNGDHYYQGAINKLPKPAPNCPVIT